MRRTLAIALFLLFCWTPAAPLFAASADSEAALLPCCRSHGAHHCMMKMMIAMRRAQSGPGFATISEKCPSFPKAAPPTHPQTGTNPVARLVSTSVYAHPAAPPQTEARGRTSFSRTRQKRGPPTLA